MKFSRLASALILILAGLVTQQLSHTTSASSSGPFTVTKVIDGDTIEINTGQKVRYIGVNTPETVDPTRLVQCYGHEASDFNHTLVAGHRITLTKDTSNTDKFGRLLRYVYLEDGTEVNLKLVQDGYAYAIAYKPDTAHQLAFDQAQHQAQAAGLGLWSACDTQLKHDK